MNEQERLDLEIKQMRIDYDISAYRTQIIEWRRKMLEAQRSASAAKNQIAELEDKIAAKELEKEQL